MASKNHDKVLKVFKRHPDMTLSGHEIAKLGVFHGTGAWVGLSELREEGLVKLIGGKGTRQDPYRYMLQGKSNGKPDLHQAFANRAFAAQEPEPSAKPQEKADVRRAVKWVLEGVSLSTIAPEDALKRIRQIVG